MINKLLLLVILGFEIQEYHQSKPDPPPKVCTLKINDSNNVTSYISGPNVNE